ncbi:KIN14B-interacting protein At4g14310 [Cynara cardunculus var. scolymus]|uniref:KIN14B-interacting protein At4g14310 n=1 Tax=Cynara cardunculus var. scolymus TaxID=59895 RepID=UPI000D624DE5|nr:KIN14B-interacting protein At4g14310 [Cynara cardunculus var. scolymus]
MSSSAVRRVKESGGGGGGAKVTTVPPTKTTRSTTPVSERFICRGGDSVNMSTGKENANSSRPSSRIRAAAKTQKPIVPPMVRVDKEIGEPRAKWSTNCSAQPRGRSSSPSEFNRFTSDARKTRVSRVSIDRNERSVSAGRSTRVSDRVGQQNKGNEIRKESKPKPVNTQNPRVSTVSPKSGRERDVVSRPETSNTQCSSDSLVKVSESVKLFERFKSKSCVGLRSSNGSENEEIGVRSSFRDSGGKFSSRGSSLDGSKEKGASEDSISGRSTAKYPSKLHGKLAFLEEKVKRIASDIKRTKEMLDLNNPDASKVMLSDIQETVAGIEKAMGDVVNGEKDKKGLVKANETNNLQVNSAKISPTKESRDTKSLDKGLNTDELEARFFPHHKLLRDRTTLKAPSVSHETLKTEVSMAISETKPEVVKSSTMVDENPAQLLISDSKVTTRGGLELCEVLETDSTVDSKANDSSKIYAGKGNVETMLIADETLEDCDEQENNAVMIFEEEIDDSCNNQLNEIGHKTCTGGWFVSEGESVLLAHDDGSCTFYDVANSEEKSMYKAPAEVSPNIWRDCWILRAPGADGCSGRYVVAASAGNGMDSGFCSWDFYTKEVRAFHIEDGVTNTRTALAPLPNNVLNRRHDLSNLTPENRQWWYKPCGPLIISTATNQKAVQIYDIRDGEHIMKWELQNPVLAMENSSPLQWRNRGKVVVAAAEGVSLWDVGSLSPLPILTAASGKKISALHVNNTDAELGGGIRQRVSSSEAEGNDGVFCTPDSINVLDFRHPSGIGLKIPKYGTNVHSVFSRGDSIYLGCSGSPSAARKPTSAAQIQHFSLRKQKLLSTYALPESNAHPHYKAVTQVWGNSNLAMGVCGLGLFVFDALKDDGLRLLGSDHGKVRETIGPDNLYCPSFDYLGSRALLISRDRPAIWKYMS